MTWADGQLCSMQPSDISVPVLFLLYHNVGALILSTKPKPFKDDYIPTKGTEKSQKKNPRQEISFQASEAYIAHITFVHRHTWPQRRLGNVVSTGMTIYLEERTVGPKHGDFVVIILRWLRKKKGIFPMVIILRKSYNNYFLKINMIFCFFQLL